MRALDINELPLWSVWPARLLGLKAFTQPKRDITKIEAEYNQDKYASCIERYKKSGGKLDPVALRFSIGGRAPEEEVAAVRDGELVIARQNELIDSLFEILHKALAGATKDSNTVIELGSAFGTNLWKLAQTMPDKRYIGGDYSENATELGALLFAGRGDIQIVKFDFYEPRYRIFDDVEAPVTVFTSQAIEQLPSATPFLDALCNHRDKIDTVIHLEPAYDLHDDNLLGLMRRRYLELNDYNRDLVSELQRRPEIRIKDLQKDVLGFNPFNALSLITWQFA